MTINRHKLGALRSDDRWPLPQRSICSLVRAFKGWLLDSARAFKNWLPNAAEATASLLLHGGQEED